MYVCCVCVFCVCVCLVPAILLRRENERWGRKREIYGTNPHGFMEAVKIRIGRVHMQVRIWGSSSQAIC